MYLSTFVTELIDHQITTLKLMRHWRFSLKHPNNYIFLTTTTFIILSKRYINGQYHSSNVIFSQEMLENGSFLINFRITKRTSNISLKSSICQSLMFVPLTFEPWAVKLVHFFWIKIFFTFLMLLIYVNIAQE